MAKKKSKTKVLVIILILIIIIAAVLLYFKIKTGNGGENGDNFLSSLTNEDKKEEVNIYKGTDRPIAVMIDNVRSSKATSRVKRCIYGL